MFEMSKSVSINFFAVTTLLLAFGICVPASGQNNDPVAGLAFARHVCADCHLVAGPDPDSLQRGPAFEELAQRTDLSSRYLRAFLEKPHGEMPDIPLAAEDINDLIAYILALSDQ